MWSRTTKFGHVREPAKPVRPTVRMSAPHRAMSNRKPSSQEIWMIKRMFLPDREKKLRTWKVIANYSLKYEYLF